MRLTPKTVVIIAALVITAVFGLSYANQHGPVSSPLAVVEERDGLVKVRHQVLDNTNRLRRSFGLRPLDLAPKLNRGAQDHSDWMARTRNFVHSTDLILQMNQAYDGNWSYAGENIGVFGGALSELLTSLRQSPEHRENMLKPQYRRMGVGATWDSSDERLWLTIWYEG